MLSGLLYHSHRHLPKTAEGHQSRAQGAQPKRELLHELVQRIVMHREWPPEILFSFKPPEILSRVTHESASMGYAGYRVTFRWPVGRPTGRQAATQVDGTA